MRKIAKGSAEYTIYWFLYGTNKFLKMANGSTIVMRNDYKPKPEPYKSMCK